jgi:hypothetical protein
MGYGETEVAGRRLYRLAADPGAHTVARLTRDRFSLLKGARCGYQLGATLLGDGVSRRARPVRPPFQPYRQR